jgi:hypothetical protein
MDETSKSEENLAEEFRKLGHNLVDALSEAWRSEERKKMQQEIEEGLVDLAATLKQEAAAFRDSPTGQRIRSDVEGFSERVRSGEAEAQVHSELLGVLRTINSELKRITSQWSEGRSASQPAPERSRQAAEAQPVGVTEPRQEA